MSLARSLDRRQGGHLVVDSLVSSGVEHVFGLPASHVIEIYDALSQTTRIKTIVARTEQGATYMADGYARRGRRPGIAVLTGGPGLGNAVTGLQTAHADSSPVVVVTSDVDPVVPGRRPMGIPHEIHDADALSAATGATVHRADTSDAIAACITSAVRGTLSGRHRPSVGVIARSALEGDAEVSGRPGGQAGSPSGDDPLRVSVDRTIELLKGSRQPLILAGAGVLWASAEDLLADTVERTGALCLTTVPARSAIDDTNPRWAGVVDNDEARQLLRSSDLVLALGTSFGWATTRAWTLELPKRLVHVDVDEAELGKHYDAELAVRASVDDFLGLLNATLPRTGSGDAAPVAARRTNDWIRALDAAVPAEATIVFDVTMALRWVSGLHASPRRRLMMPWNSMNMGWAYPAALGAQVAARDEVVVAIVGDGGALFSLGEIATAIEGGLPVCLVIFNNHSYGTIADLQDEVCGGRRFGVDLVGPDFVAVASAFGMAGYAVDSPAALGQALQSALTCQEPTLIEVAVAFEDLR